MTAARLDDLNVSPLCLGGNVFGWTVGAEDAFPILDAFAEGGGNFIDTADQYVDWMPGGRGGESEEMIGDWMADRGNREQIIVGTKVGKLADAQGLSAASIQRGVEASLRRLRTDYIDVYYAHEDDPSTPLSETYETLQGLVQAGKIRRIGVSNYSADRLQEVVDVARGDGPTTVSVIQPHYNLMRRDIYEGGLERISAREGIACVPYFSLANGFLTGKYRPGVEVDSARARAVNKYLDDRGLAILAVLDEISESHNVGVAAVALGWLVAQPTVVSAVSSARTPAQVRELLQVSQVTLSPEDVQRLSDVSRPVERKR